MMLKYAFVLLFVAVYAVFSHPAPGYSHTSPLWTHLTYMFAHASAIHLLLNSLAFVGLFREAEKLTGRWKLAAALVGSGFALSFVTGNDIPTVGASGMIYCMIGMLLHYKYGKIQLRFTGFSTDFIFPLTVAVSLLISLLNPNSNTMLHFLSMLAGILVLKKPVFFNKNLKNDKTDRDAD